MNGTKKNIEESNKAQSDFVPLFTPLPLVEMDFILPLPPLDLDLEI